MKRLAVALAISVGAARVVAAQATSDSLPALGTIDGLVSDTTLTPLAGASVTILSTTIHVETGASGRFRILRLPAGQYLLIIRHLGHRPASGIISVPANDTARLSYTLEPAVVALEGMVVSEQALSATLLDFEQRRRMGQGTFLTQAEIDRRNTVFTTELLRGIPSIALLPSHRGGMTSYEVVSTRLGGCRAELFVDGVRLPPQTNTDDLPPPREIAGIEVYAGPGTVPPQYAGGRTTCGVVLIWTRHGS
jgi:hypothetical protein